MGLSVETINVGVKRTVIFLTARKVVFQKLVGALAARSWRVIFYRRCRGTLEHGEAALVLVDLALGLTVEDFSTLADRLLLSPETLADHLLWIGDQGDQGATFCWGEPSLPQLHHGPLGQAIAAIEHKAHNHPQKPSFPEGLGSLWPHLAQTTTDQICLYDPQGRCCYVNQPWLTQWQLPESAVIGQLGWGLNPHLPWAKAVGHLLQEIIRHPQARKGSLPLDMERRSDQRLHYHFLPLPQGPDRPPWILYVGQCHHGPVTIRQWEQANRFFEISQDLFCISNFQGQFIRLNPAWEKTLGYSVGELMSKPFVEFIHPEDRQNTIDTFSQNREGATVKKFQNRYHCRNGQYKWLEWIAIAFVEEKLVFAIARDVTARNQYLESLELQSQIINQVHDAVIVADISGLIEFANHSTQRLLGHDPSALIGKHLSHLFPSSFHEQLIKVLAPQLLQQGFFNLEVQVLTSDRQLRWVALSISVITNAKGQNQGLTCYFFDLNEQKKAELALAASEIRFRKAILEAPFPIMLHEKSGAVALINTTWTELSGYTLEDIPTVETWCNKVYDGKTSQEVLALVQQSIYGKNQRTNDGTFLIKTAWGDQRFWHFSSAPLGEKTDPHQLFISMAMDITQQKQAEQALARQEEEFHLLFDFAPIGLGLMTLDGDFLRVNRELCQLLGYPKETLLAMNYFSLIHPDYREQAIARQRELPHQATPCCELEQCYVTAQEHTLYTRSKILLIPDYGPHPRLLLQVLDLTAQKQSEQQLRHDALHDQLTKLPNRFLFLERVELALKHYHRQDQQEFAVLCLDVDRFKVINDSIGHTMGDKLLQKIAELLQSYVRECDTVARLGGDEFGILLEELETYPQTLQLIQKIQQHLQWCFHLEGQTIYASASVGVVFSHGHYQSSMEILRDADIAMYRAKASTTDKYAIFDQKMHHQMMRNLQLDLDLRKALEEEQFTVEYQPIINLFTGKIEAFEALLRWHHPDHGLVSPTEFIPIAEETGLIVEIGAWVLNQACGQTRRWQQAIASAANLQVSVNFSGKQLQHPGILTVIDQTLARHDLAPQSLKVEITETILVKHQALATELLRAIHDRHIAISLDDFGTGYSSLSYLHQFPIDILKVDQCFVRRFDQKQSSLSLVEGILSLAHHLQLQAIAEGIETQEQLRLLQRLGCNYGQGYFFSKPLPADLATEFLIHNPHERPEETS